jgi:hypothetical protein
LPEDPAIQDRSPGVIAQVAVALTFEEIHSAVVVSNEAGLARLQAIGRRFPKRNRSTWIGRNTLLAVEIARGF